MPRNLPLEIERLEQRTMNTHRDFVQLSKNVQDATGEYISPTTLKRMWGRQKDHCHPSAYSMNLLAHYLGYACYEAFLENLPPQYESSAIVTDFYSTENLTVGDCLQLNWKPNRVARIRYEGDDRFTVYEAQHSKISVGDSFRCQVFVNGETATLNQLQHGGKGPYVYVIGKKEGVCITPIIPNE